MSLVPSSLTKRIRGARRASGDTHDLRWSTWRGFEIREVDVMRSFRERPCPTEEEFMPVEGASADDGDPPPLHAASRAAAAVTPEA
jgi:hypothetical protein